MKPVAAPFVDPPRIGKWYIGNPEWEAVEAARSNLSHAELARECTQITANHRKHNPGGIAIDHLEIVRLLTNKKIPFVLTGLHGITGWLGRSRATKDVDVLVKSGRNLTRAVNAIAERFPHLEKRVFFGVTGFFPPGINDSVVDVTYPHRKDNVETLRTAIWIEDGDLRYRIPTLEAALANKYGAMLTLSRNPGKRTMDAADFYAMVLRSTDPGREAIDLERLAELGELVWPGGGGREIVHLVEQAKAGKVPPI